MLQEKYVQSITTAKSELTGRIKGRTVIAHLSQVRVRKEVKKVQHF